MKKIELLKTGAEIVVSIGVGAIVGNAVIFTTPLKVKAVQKACISVGSFVVSSMVSDKASDYVKDKIEDIKEAFKGNKDEINSEEIETEA